MPCDGQAAGDWHVDRRDVATARGRHEDEARGTRHLRGTSDTDPSAATTLHDRPLEAVDGVAVGVADDEPLKAAGAADAVPPFKKELVDDHP